MRTLLLTILLLLPAIGQDLKPVEPVRVTVRTLDNELNNEIAEAIKEELRRLPSRDILITNNRPDFVITFDALRLEGCVGLAASVVTVNTRLNTQGLRTYTSLSTRSLSRLIVSTVNEDHFEPLRARAVSQK
jgi:hypothetical protein